MYDTKIAFAETRFGTLCQFCAEDMDINPERVTWKRSQSVKLVCTNCEQSNDPTEY